MVPTKLKRSWLLYSLIGLITLCLPAVAQPADHPYTFGAIPLSKEEYQSYLKVTPRGELQALESTLPLAYNVADLGFVTPAKDQGKCGACWAFALVGAMESKLLMSGLKPLVTPLDLSEQQQVSCNTTEASGCRGGYLTAALFWAPPPNPNSGPLPESVFPYTASDATCHNPSESQLNYRVKDFYTVPVSINEFKASLYKEGPGPIMFLVMEDFIPFWESAPPNSVYKYQEGFIEGLHAVLLIGWDDTKQAFLLKNSYGDKAGPNGNGTFWMSYEAVGGVLLQMVNFSITAVDPPTPTPPIPTTPRWMLIVAALSLFLSSLQSLRRRI